ncbi:MAG: 3-deoxy-8-phosphooctulonate synthase [Candidatus Omnitrophota bacterium]|jgi:2-dehydro-3-deoxyphosphooctonate aldolase (KDO 8-P synthase)
MKALTKEISVGGKVKAGGACGPVLIAGPCVIESEKHCLLVGRKIKDIAAAHGIQYIFKASYDKANRLSGDSFRGPGIKAGLKILAGVKKTLGVPLLSDVHCCGEVAAAARVLDVLQIPAFLCRQTDLVEEAARSGRAVNIKKGQFLAPWDIAPIVAKAEACGNKRILLTDRGFSFGYNNLVSDLRSLAIMRRTGYPVIYDATHSVQLPGGKGASSSGQREFVEGLARAAVAFGCDGLFLEVHPDPDSAPCDGPNMIGFDMLDGLLCQVRAIHDSLKEGA